MRGPLPIHLVKHSAPIGLRYSIVELGGRVSAAIKAAATRGRLNVISSPHILASNNKEAKIQIGSSQPILTNTYTTTATGTPGVVEGTIEYKDVGIILTVTPRISDGGLVTLEITIEDSSRQVYHPTWEPLPMSLFLRKRQRRRFSQY